MSTTRPLVMLATALGLALGINAPGHTQATQSRFTTSNAVDKCQAFTPGVTNTIRNRVSGAENVGTATIAVACNFELNLKASASVGEVNLLEESFQNGDTVPVSVSCSLLPGDYIDGFGEIESQTVEIAPGEIGTVSYTGPYDVAAIGINCQLPPKVIIAHTAMRYLTGPAP